MDLKNYINSEKPNLIMMIGISGSGKSTIARTIAEQLGEDKTIILSSDELRKELFSDVNDQNHNEIVFKTIQKRTFSFISKKNNGTVIIDATNLSLKDRSWIFNSWKKEYDCNKIACVIPTPFKKCKEQNKDRERIVPEYVLDRQIRKFDIPFYEEGWDKILIWDVEDFDVALNTTYKNKIGSPDVLFNQMKNFDQKNTHHQYFLDIHCFKAYKELLKMTDNSIFLRASQIHDIGKPFVQAPRENNPNHSYFNHHNYGAYYALSNWREIGIRDWMNINTVDGLLECLFYINYHMQPFFILKEKSENKYCKLWGEEKYNNLMVFNKCDKIASGTERNK